ncbi:MAG: BACON domain-containing protein [Bacteroidales bacterium]|nr:BACON domain-containing protein [Bacteroidales bacterium]
MSKTVQLSQAGAPAPTLELSSAELSWEWDDTEPQTVTVSANYDWVATVSDAANWVLTPASDGKTFTIAPKSELKSPLARTATITVTSRELSKTVTCTQTGGPFVSGHQYVDLGLSVKWATCNIGAVNVTDAGSHFAWGETDVKDCYTEGNDGEYKWGLYDSSAAPDYGYTKYNYTDGPYSLLPADDPATVSWGSKWRTPSTQEFNELKDNTKCKLKWTTMKDTEGNDVYGCLVTSRKNGNSIFLPVTGFFEDAELKHLKSGYYWTALFDKFGPCYAYAFNFSGSGLFSIVNHMKYFGCTIRAVTK